MRIGICDDMATDRRVLKHMLDEYFAARGVPYEADGFPSAQAMLDTFFPGKYAMLFLDIYMPGMTGMDAAKTIRNTDGACKLIFVTTSEDHALDSYGVYAAGYLLKPFTVEQLTETLDWCMESIPVPAPQIEIISDRRRVFVAPEDIIYIEIYGREALLHTRDDTYPVNRTLGSLEQELPTGFLRCNRSYVINMNHVQNLYKSSFTMTGGASIPISIDAHARVKQEFFDWMFGRIHDGRQK